MTRTKPAVPSGGPVLTRRALLAGGAGALLGAAIGLPPAAGGVLEAPDPRLVPLDADVWGVSIEVEGAPASTRLSVDRQPVPTIPGPGGFRADVPLRPAQNMVVATARVQKPASTRRRYNARLADRPTARVSVSTAGDVVRLDAVASEPDPYEQAPIESVSWRRRDGAYLGTGPVLTLGGPWPDGEHYVVATVRDKLGHLDETTVVFVVEGGRPRKVDLRTWQPRWVDSAVVYGAIPPLFGRPPLEAVTASMDRLAALGINVVWLSPVFATIPGDFGYSVTDYFRVRPDFGDLAALQSLVAAAHARGIRVILDLPLNDTSNRHPYFRQAKGAGEASHYWSFYERNRRGQAVHYFDWTDLPNLAYDNVEVRRMATEVGLYWLQVADVDGFRCDAAWGVRQRRPEFWAQWQADLRRIRPDILLIAEATARDSWWSTHGFSAAYDWTGELGQWAWAGAFRQPDLVTARLSAVLGRKPGSRPFRFLDNEDTGARFITRYGPGMTRAAAALVLALPGLPCVFTGEEIGARYEPYERTAPLDWERDPHHLQGYYRSLIARRREQPVTAGGSLMLASASPADRVLAYTVSGPQAYVLVAVNFSAEEVTATVDAGAGRGGRTTLRIPAWSAVTASGD